mgnify:CR=1 FL=1
MSSYNEVNCTFMISHFHLCSFVLCGHCYMCKSYFWGSSKLGVIVNELQLCTCAYQNYRILKQRKLIVSWYFLINYLEIVELL